MDSLERRYFIRARVDFPIIVRPEGAATGQSTLRAMDISVDGIHLLSEEALTLDAVLLLDFPPEWGAVSVKAKVIRRDGDHYGCQFVDLPEAVRHDMDGSIYRSWRGSVPETVKGL
ncbi:MAG: PilZ domain-containing protein [Negativicutes bacterium]|nr:PilZ domain-containing protein [Negativicutes bacterium]